MIIGENREAVIENIKAAAESGDFHKKVEISDPVLTAEETDQIIDNYLSSRNTVSYKFKCFIARRIVDFAEKLINKDTDIVGEENLPETLDGVLITSNHFSPIENTVIRKMVKKHGKHRLHIVSQTTNFAMKGFVGFLLNYADTIPIIDDPRYLARKFTGILSGILSKKRPVLIYPEQEMWFNYKKPRPPKRGVYYYASKLNAPIISCFVEMTELDQNDTKEFLKVKYTLHILGTLRPDLEKSAKENSYILCEKDYALKKAAYEKIYGKPLTYNFEKDDIAGWLGGEHHEQ